MRLVLNVLLIMLVAVTLGAVSVDRAFAVPCSENYALVGHHEQSNVMHRGQAHMSSVGVSEADLASKQMIRDRDDGQRTHGFPAGQSCCQPGIGSCCGTIGVTPMALADPGIPFITAMGTLLLARDEIRAGMSYPPIPTPPKILI